MTTPEDEQPVLVVLCDYCTPRRSPVDARVFRDCEWCSARQWPVWCECLWCDWLPLLPRGKP